MLYFNSKISFLNISIWIALLLLMLGLSIKYTGDVSEFILIYLNVAIVSAVLILPKNKDLFDPFHLFSLFYMMFIASAYVLRINGFDNNYFLSTVSFYSDLDSLFLYGLVALLVSYVSAFFGYYFFSENNSLSKPIYSRAFESKTIIYIAVMLYGIGVVNFVLNVIIISSGDIIVFYKTISMRFYDFQKPVTTLGYHCMYIACYIFFISAMQKNKLSITVGFLIALSFIMMLSNGRIGQSIFYITTFFIIYYYYNGRYKLNFIYSLLGILLILVGVSVYGLRIASSLSINSANNEFDFSSYIHEFISVDYLSHILFEKGYTPNFALLMKVIDSWSYDIGYMYGATILHPIFSFASPNVFGLVEMPAVLAKQQWYMHTQDGNLPVTGIGEMYVNFSYMGFIFGMFLFGALGALIRNFMVRTRSAIFLIFYAKFIIGFYMLYPKGELNNLSLFWMLFPSISIYIIILFIKNFNKRALESRI
ncbi:O-antigen polymerase [Aeromonas salmonicida]|uniref:O-antigen polymerase n=1 Tax=Aeromonas salmonicida TaxID=645 RepID=UPI003D1EE02E